MKETNLTSRFFFLIFKLYNIVLVLPNIEMNPPLTSRFKKAGAKGQERIILTRGPSRSEKQVTFFTNFSPGPDRVRA